MQKESKVFYCYNPKVRRYLADNNIRWFDKGINPKSGFPYWMYDNNNKLKECLTEYKSTL